VSAPSAVAVVIPARDEEVLLPACLESVRVARDVLHLAHPDVRTEVFVVLDVCRDDTAGVVARHGVRAIASRAGNVGAARALGVETAADWAGDPSRLWIASTDADSAVPPHWLLTQVGLAAEGRDLVVGTVSPRPVDLSPDVLAAWHARHTLSDGHEHVHGANLGFSLDAYLHVGGFAPLPVHEDVELVEAMRRASLDWVATGAIDVTTSGRRTARAPLGFASYLEGLGA
jgi:glycosyltransferase involved in cell wall biosynthesis